MSDTLPQRPRWLIVVQQRELYNVLRERFASLGIVGSSTGAARSAGERLRGGHRNGGEPTGGNDTRSRGCIPPRRRISSLLTNILTRIVVASPTRAAGGGGHKAA